MKKILTKSLSIAMFSAVFATFAVGMEQAKDSFDQFSSDVNQSLMDNPGAITKIVDRYVQEHPESKAQVIQLLEGIALKDVGFPANGIVLGLINHLKHAEGSVDDRQIWGILCNPRAQGWPHDPG